MFGMHTRIGNKLNKLTGAKRVHALSFASTPPILAVFTNHNMSTQSNKGKRGRPKKSVSGPVDDIFVPPTRTSKSTRILQLTQEPRVTRQSATASGSLGGSGNAQQHEDNAHWQPTPRQRLPRTTAKVNQNPAPSTTIQPPKDSIAPSSIMASSGPHTAMPAPSGPRQTAESLMNIANVLQACARLEKQAELYAYSDEEPMVDGLDPELDPGQNNAVENPPSDEGSYRESSPDPYEEQPEEQAKEQAEEQAEEEAEEQPTLDEPSVEVLAVSTVRTSKAGGRKGKKKVNPPVMDVIIDDSG